MKLASHFLIIFTVILSSLFVLTSPTHAQTTSDLTIYWPLDETSGITATDTSGNNNHGEVIGDGFWTPVGINGARSFDGQNDRIQVPLTGTNTYTYSFWVSMATLNPTNQAFISQNVGGSNGCHYLNYEHSRIHFRGQSGDTISHPYSNESIMDWTHITASHDDATGVSKLYLNGQLVATAGRISCTQGWNNQLVVGEPAYGPSTSDFNGYIDEVRIYNRALTDAEVSQIYSSATPAPDTFAPQTRVNYPTIDTLVVGTTTTTLHLNTDELATCKFSTTPNTPYDQMETIFETTNNAIHNHRVTELQDGQNYNFYVKCTDDFDNTNTTDTPISFSVSGNAYQPPPTDPNIFYAAPGIISLPEDDTVGTFNHPFDIHTALAGGNNGQISPGATVYLRGGTYHGNITSRLNGTAESPITVRPYPEEWAVIDSLTSTSETFSIRSNHTHYFDLEFKNSISNADRSAGLGFYGGGNKLINSYVHDVGGNSFGRTNQVYGSIFYNNGNDDDGRAHHLYTQNDNDVPAVVEDSIIFQSFAFGMHAYAGGAGILDNIHMIGSVWFNNGLAQAVGDKKDDILVGGANGSNNILMRENMTWTRNPTGERTASLGRYSDNTNFDLFDNYLIGVSRFYNLWDGTNTYTPGQASEITGNTFGAAVQNGSGDFNPQGIAGNTYLTQTGLPTQNKIFIRPNTYDDDRANIIVYNWQDLNKVSVDVSHILEIGDEYQVRNGQNFFDTPVLSGTYQGESLALPMDAGSNPAQPIPTFRQPGLIEDSEKTGRAFNVFVLMPPLEYDAPPPGTSPNNTPGDYEPPENPDGDVDINDFWEVITNFIQQAYTIFDFNQVISNFGTQP